jgi:hypothetical protein
MFSDISFSLRQKEKNFLRYYPNAPFCVIIKGDKFIFHGGKNYADRKNRTHRRNGQHCSL